MLSAKILISGLGVVSVVAGFAVYNNFSDDSNKEKGKSVNKKFLIATLSNKSQIPSSGLLKNEKPNYICKVNTENIKDCEIYKLNTNDNKKTLLNNSDDISNGSTFVISYPEKEHTKIKQNTTILVASENGTKYFDLTINSNLFNYEKGIKSQTIIAKINTVESSIGNATQKTPYKLDKDKNCKIYKLSNHLDLSTTSIPFSTSSLNIDKQITKKSDIAKGDYVLIESVTDNMFESDWKDSLKEIYLNNARDKFLTFEYISTTFGDLNSANGFNEIIENENAYIIVSASDINSSNSSTFYTDNTNGYECQVSTSTSINEVDNSCQLYKLNTSSDSDEKTVDLYKIISDETNSKLTTAPANGKKFLLKISRNLIERITADSKISLIDKSTPAKEYSKLTKIHELKKDTKGFKTNYVILKVKSKVSTTPTLYDNNNYKCKFKETDQNFIDCKVFNFQDQHSVTAANPVLDVSKLQELKESTKSNLADNKYVLIKFEGVFGYKTEKEHRSYNPIIYETKTNESTPTEFFKSEYIESYIGDTNTTLSNSQLFKIVESPQDYLVVVHDLTSDSSTKETVNFVENSTTKNYSCELGSDSNKKIDTKCTLIPLTKSNRQGINLTDIYAANTEVSTASTFAQDKYFKLIVKSPDFINKTYGENDLITIASIKQSSPSKTYGKVRVISKFTYENLEGEANLFLAKIKTPAATSPSVSTFKCKYDTNGTYSSCDIYKTSTTITNNEYKNANLSQFSKNSVTQADLSTGSYLIVDLKTSKHSISDFANKTIGIANGSTGSQDTNISVLDIISPLHAKITGDSIPENTIMFVQ